MATLLSWSPFCIQLVLLYRHLPVTQHSHQMCSFQCDGVLFGNGYRQIFISTALSMVTTYELSSEVAGCENNSHPWAVAGIAILDTHSSTVHDRRAQMDHVPE
ncbi:hypothetical protein FISHEDRAFT_57715, partial [Fistulina hepatica ATCC 64428]